MSAGTGRVRLRQAVLVAAELEPLAAQLRARLGLNEPFRDPGVAEFGLVNVVFALGDCFLEVVSPTRPGTAAGRQLERAGGDGGYMVLFDIEDLEGARQRAERLGVRTVWRIDLPDISGTHLHPADMRGAIVSLDRSAPYGTWRWGGPDWTARTGTAAPGRLTGITVAVGDPDAVAARWAEVLGVPIAERSNPTLALDGGQIQFCDPVEEGREEIVEIAMQIPAAVRDGRESIAVGRARIALSDLA
ncbi:MAG: VOC family protein [Solirubrobacteraceae bacterium]